MPHPARSKLFPYTTLFRSKERRLRQSDLVKGTKIEAKTISRIARGFHTQTRKLELIANYLMVPLERVLVSPLRRGSDEEDRKSTRLNSSHLGISYAVFCLK